MTKYSFNLKNKALIVACFAVSSLLLVSSCKKDDKKDDNPTLTGIEFEKPAISLVVNRTYELNVVPVPFKAELPTCTFASDNKDVATVSNEGKVAGVSKGKATITATASGFTAICTVTVTDGSEPPLTGIEFEGEGSANLAITLKTGGTYQIKIVAVPASAFLPDVNFTSDNAGVATVNSAGMITAKADGKTTITATAGGFTANCTVTVTNGSEPPDDVQQLIKYKWDRSFSYWYWGYLYFGFEFYFFYKDGTFISDNWRASLGCYKYIGNYSVSGGKISLTNIKCYIANVEDIFQGDEGDMALYEFVENCPNLVTEYKFDTDEKGDYLFMGSVHFQGNYGHIGLSDCYEFKKKDKNSHSK
jgi:hypothetical protein